MSNLLRSVSISLMLFLLSFTFSLHAQDIADKAEKVTPLLISSYIPDVNLRTVDGKKVDLREKVSERPTILIFYRGGWCPYCNQHLSDLQKIEDELYEIGYQILAISPDRPEKLRATLQNNALDYTLLSDSPMTASKAFGLAFKVDPETVERYKTIGIDLEEDSGYDHHLLPAPAVYIVDTSGQVKFIYVNPNYKERINGEVLLTAAREYYPQQ